MSGRHWVWLGLLILGGLGLLGYRAATTSLGITTGTSRNEVFYRFQASYTVDKTETVSMDVVVACNVEVTNYKSGGSSVRTGRTPTHYPIKTKANHAILVQVPNACIFIAYGEKLSDRVFPLVQWIESADDLRSGTGYVTEDAYASPLSRLALNGANVSKATRAEWETWRSAAAKDFLPSDAVPEPWGFDDRELNRPDRLTQHYLARQCHAMSRFEIPQDLQARLQGFWPRSRPDLWDVPREARQTVFDDVLSKGRFGGFVYSDYIIYSSGAMYAQGVRRRDGSGGILLLDKLRPRPVPEVYPVRRSLMLQRGIKELKEEAVSSFALENEAQQKGFAYCYLTPSQLKPSKDVSDIYDVLQTKPIVMRVGHRIVSFEDRKNIARVLTGALVPMIAERDQQIYVDVSIGF